MHESTKTHRYSESENFDEKERFNIIAFII